MSELVLNELQNQFYKTRSLKLEKAKKCKFDKLRFALEYGFNKTFFFGFYSKIFSAIFVCAKLGSFLIKLLVTVAGLRSCDQRNRVRSAKDK